ncbi:hypothetical protein D1AOALGA4SA_11627 [Olavius algarvensis Delta 1 endosymbiont]|nr:hypothetical protein D1AOALGA4SA_11627 [Olavius algarvensis Delta 1 endosymbiont]
MLILFLFVNSPGFVPVTICIEKLNAFQLRFPQSPDINVMVPADGSGHKN